MSYRQIRKQLGISTSTIYRIVRSWRNDHQIQRRVGSGRQRISTRIDDERLQTLVQDRPFTTAFQAFRQINFLGSVWTARRRLREVGLRNRIAAKKIRHREIRMGFALQYLHGYRRRILETRSIFGRKSVPVISKCPFKSLSTKEQ
jgi:transposase